MTTASTPGIDTRPTDLTTFVVKVDGEVLPGTCGIVSIDIMRELNRIPCASLVLHDGDAASQDFEISGGPLLVPGRTIEIEAGYSSDNNLVFKGVITAQRIRVKRRGNSLLHVEARDPAFRMTLKRKSARFLELTDSELFREIIGGYEDLTAEVAATSAEYPVIVQYQMSDWDFIVSRAEKAGLYCAPVDGNLRIARPDPGRDPVLVATYGQNIFDLDLNLDARRQFGKVTAASWDHADQEVITAEAEDVESPDQGNLSFDDLVATSGVEDFRLEHSGALPQQELDVWAEAGLRRARFAKIRGTIRLQGSSSLQPGDMIELTGAGARFNGRAFVSGVRHALGRGDWETSVQLGLRPDWHHERFAIGAPPAGGAHPPIHGLHTGIVTQLESDPASAERVRVRIPLINAEDDGIWARLATLDAGAERGTVFRPEIGDEVIVGFVHGSPNEPVVLGMLHSRDHPAPIAASDDNHEKGLKTRSGIRILFNDEEVRVTVETPGGRKLVLDDGAESIELRDDAGSVLKMDSDGIALETPAGIMLKAQRDVTLEGLNVDVKATAQLQAEGSAGAVLKSGGNTEVQGALVRIN